MTSQVIRLPHRKSNLTATFLRGRNSLTAKNYERDLEYFRAFLNASDIEGAAQILLAAGPGEANGLARDYRAALIDQGLSPATVNRRLSTLRSLVRLARTLGLVTWALEIENMKAAAYRDTRGPGLVGYRLLLDQAGKEPEPKRARDVALLRLLFDLGLRRGEVVSLDLADVDLTAGTLSILGKGRTQKEALTLPTETRAALMVWLKVREVDHGPLFVSLDTGHKEQGRLTGNGLYRIIHTLGKRAGLNVHPHSIRHSSITIALDLFNGDLRKVARFSRHRNIQTLTIYDDNRLDLAGDVSRKLAGLLR
jgi:integrase/recombinase XerC